MRFRDWLYLALGACAIGALAYVVLYARVWLLVWGMHHFALSAGAVQ